MGLPGQLKRKRGGPLVIQYWSSIEALYRHAADPESSHRPARAASNRRAQQAPGAVGIWHEI
ncbi:monooxygenase family protein [Nesterenkonia sp. AN1]|uniref:monooxygenase family protein n=1 Tax=Nesterenkonia sp. AN1 TaxID=652017 RepID=UPI000A04717F